MSTLQLSLVIVGALVVLAVYLFNVLQERRARRRLRDDLAATAARTAERDVDGAVRIEPSLRVPGAPTEALPASEPQVQSSVSASGAASATGAAAARDSVPAHGPGSAQVAVDVAEATTASRAMSRVMEGEPAASRHPTAAVPSDSPPVTPAATSAPAPHVAGAYAADVRRIEDGPDEDTEYVVVLTLRGSVPAASLGGDASGESGKRVRWFVRDAPGSAWTALQPGAAGTATELAACLMLVDRDGPLTPEQLQGFVRMVADRAASLSAEVRASDPDAVLDRARTLDRICAEVDVQIGINLVRPDGVTPSAIAGTRLRGVAEAAGFRLGTHGQFEYFHEDSDLPLFALQGQRGEALTPETLRALQLPGVTLLLDIPRTPDAVKAFDQMRAIAKRLASTLETVLVDDNRRPLTDAALGTIRSQVHETVAAMRASHIEPGSPRALRLFD